MRQCRAQPIDPEQAGPDGFVYGWYCKIDGISLNKKLGIRYYIVPEIAYIYLDAENERFIAGIIEVIPSTVGQDTGLKDKNGKAIYENGKVKGVDEIFVVVWHFNRWVMKNVETGRINEFRQIDQVFYEIIHDKESDNG